MNSQKCVLTPYIQIILHRFIVTKTHHVVLNLHETRCENNKIDVKEWSITTNFHGTIGKPSMSKVCQCGFVMFRPRVQELLLNIEQFLSKSKLNFFGG